MNKDNITLNPDKLDPMTSDTELPVVLKTLDCLKNLSFTSEYSDILNTPKKLSEFENDISTDKYSVYKVFNTTYKYTYNSADLVDGVVKYTLPDTYKSAYDTVELYHYNIRLIEGEDFSLNANTVILNFIPAEDEVIVNLIKRVAPIANIEDGEVYPLIEGMVPESRKVANIPLTGDITLQDLINAGLVPNTITIAGLPLNSNITVEQLKAAGISQDITLAQLVKLGVVPKTRTVAGLSLDKDITIEQLKAAGISQDITLEDLIKLGVVPNTRTIAGLPLNSDISLTQLINTGIVPSNRTIAGLSLDKDITVEQLKAAGIGKDISLIDLVGLGAVPNTRTIAGLSLDKDISVADLNKAGVGDGVKIATIDTYDSLDTVDKTLVGAINEVNTNTVKTTDIISIEHGGTGETNLNKFQMSRIRLEDGTDLNSIVINGIYQVGANSINIPSYYANNSTYVGGATHSFLVVKSLDDNQIYQEFISVNYIAYDTITKRKFWRIKFDTNEWTSWYEDITTRNISEHVTNPNLLINGDFKIWQRGTNFTQYANTSKYTADRWIIGFVNDGANHTIKKDTNGSMYVDPVAGYTKLRQYIDPNDFIGLLGKSVTISTNAKCIDGKPLQFKLFADDVIVCGGSMYGDGTYKTVAFSGIMPTTISSNIYIEFYIFQNNITNIKWVKLEISDYATPFVSKSYAEELALCQRYYQQFNLNTGWAASTGGSAGTGFVNISLACPMRISNPTINGATLKIRGAGKASTDVGGYSLYMCNTNILILTLTMPSGFTANNMYWTYVATGTLAIDAEIY